MLKEDIDAMHSKADEIINIIIDNIICGPELTTEQIMAIWTIISEKANKMKLG